MDTPSDPLERIAQELADQSPPTPLRALPAPTMGRLLRTNYSHDGMIDLIIGNPGISQDQIAALTGYTPSWISNIMASDAFQSRLAARREEVIDPLLKLTVEERLKGLVQRSHEVLMRKLDAPQVSDTVALKCLELGAKALGLGGNAPPPAPVVDLNRLADKMLALNAGEGRIIEQEG